MKWIDGWMIHYSVNFCEQNCTFKIYQTKLFIAAEHTEDAPKQTGLGNWPKPKTTRVVALQQQQCAKIN